MRRARPERADYHAARALVAGTAPTLPALGQATLTIGKIAFCNRRLMAGTKVFENGRADMRSCSTRIVLLAALFLAAPVPALADVYKWVDERGVVNYGDAPPAQHARSARTLALDPGDTNVVPGIPREELQRMREADTARRLRQLELEVEELRAREASRAATPAAQPAESGTFYGYPAYPYPAYRVERRSDRRIGAAWIARPIHPIAQPLPGGRSPRHGSRARLPGDVPFVPVKR